MARQKLPNRRMNKTAELIYDGAPYAVTIGFHPTTGKAREIFCHGAKVGSSMDGILDDACIALSLLLQHGVGLASLAATMGRLGEGQQRASVIGALVDVLAREAAPG